jgi:hypothetical protein
MKKSERTILNLQLLNTNKKHFVSTNVASKARSLAWILFFAEWWFIVGGLYQPLIND